MKMQQHTDGSHSETGEPLEETKKKQANNNHDILTPNHRIGFRKRVGKEAKSQIVVRECTQNG
jgi:hypothetical protein